MKTKPITVHFNTKLKKVIRRFGTEAGAIRAIEKHCLLDDSNTANLLWHGESRYFDRGYF